MDLFGTFCTFLTVTLCYFQLSSAVVTLKTSDLKVEVSNDLIKLNFKSDATLSTLYVGDVNIISGESRSFYLDWTGTAGETRFHPKNLTIVEETDTRAHFYWTQDSSITEDALNIELHYILEDHVSGVYSYAKYVNDKNTNVSFGETRMVYRFSPSVLTEASNQVRVGLLPTEAEINKCKTVQDSTYEFPNGTYFTKYDYAVYIRETNYQGVFGNGYGAFVVSPSREYHGGGPLKQDLTVHQYSLVTNYFVSAHFGTGTFNAPSGWEHIYGPFLMYFPNGEDNTILSAVDEQVKAEKGKWPYAFVDDAQYPLKRGAIRGTVNGQSNATVVVFDSITEEFQVQKMGYLYSTNTDSAGNYAIEGIRPGYYKVVAYPIAGAGSENLAEDYVDITSDEVKQVDLTLPEPENILWSIGQANRRSNEFMYADQERNYKWEFEPPTEISFTIGQSDPKNDWYYSQSQPGTWRIIYQDSQDGNSRTLRLPIAGASKSSLTVTLNGVVLDTLDLDNDQSIYRSAMQSGRYRSVVLQVEANQVVTGENTIELTLSSGAVMYDAVSLQVNK